MTVSQTSLSCVTSARSSSCIRDAVIAVLVLAACTGNRVRIDNAYFEIIVLRTQIVLRRIGALQVWRLQRVAIMQFFRAVKKRQAKISREQDE